MICTNCGHEAVEGADFCTNCGRTLNDGCRECGAENPADASFCHKCGSALERPNEQPDLRAAAGRPPLAGAQVSCPRCARVNEPGSTFCYNCGLPLDGAEPGVTGQVRATFWIRVGAYLIDGILLALVVSLPAYLTAGSTAGDWTPSFFEVAYFTIAVAIWGQTIGKRALRLKVVRPDGSRVGFWRALARALAYYLSGIILLIGFLMVAFRKDRRALHDLICDTVVVRVEN